MNKYTSIRSEGCIVEFDFEYQKKLQELHNDYPLAPDNIEIKREMLSEYQLKIADLYIIPTGNFKNQCLTFLIKESMCFLMKTCNFTWD